MASNTGAGYSSVYIFLAILVFLVLRRLRRAFTGSKVSKARTIGYSIYYFAIAALFMVVSFFYGLDPYYAILYVLIGLVAVYASYKFSDRRIGFWRGSDGSIYYKGAIVIYVIYVVGLIARIAIELAFIGPQAFSFGLPSGTVALSPAALAAEIVTDSLLSFGAGLLIGRNMRVLRRYSLIVQGVEPVSDSPPQIGL